MIVQPLSPIGADSERVRRWISRLPFVMESWVAPLSKLRPALSYSSSPPDCTGASAVYSAVLFPASAVYSAVVFPASAVAKKSSLMSEQPAIASAIAPAVAAASHFLIFMRFSLIFCLRNSMPDARDSRYIL